MLPKFNVLKANSIKEASELAQKYGSEAKFYAGGTDIFIWFHDDVVVFPYVISIANIPELKGIKEMEDGSTYIGACETFNDIVSNPIIIKKYPYFLEAMNKIASYQVRNLATIGGNICNAVPSADSAPVLLVAGAQCLISDGKQERTMSLEDFITSPRHTALQTGELLKGFVIPAPKAGERGAFLKRGPRKAMTISMVCVASKLVVNNGVIEDVAIALGAVAIKPVRAHRAEKMLIGQKYSEKLIKEAAAYAAENECKPITDVRASAEYRRALVEVMTGRTLLTCAE